MIESRGVLILEKKDFTLRSRERDIEDLHMTDIRGSIEYFKRASMVIIFDKGKMKILKSKYPLQDETKYFIGVDPAMGKDHSVTSKIHPDGRIEILKKKQ